MQALLLAVLLSAPMGLWESKARSVAGAVRTHNVRRGQTLSGIARSYGTTVDSLAYANRLPDPDKLYIGQKLVIPAGMGTAAQGAGTAYPVYHTVRPGETLWRISRRHGVALRDLARLNKLQNPDKIRAGTKLLVKAAAWPGRSGSPASRGDVPWGLQGAPWPAKGQLSSGFGMRWGKPHEGIDIAMKPGTPVRAILPGVVKYAGWASGYGLLVTVDHGGGWETRYAHNGRATVSVGDRVARLQRVALSGDTGRSTGPHLHFEVRWQDIALDPMEFLSASGS
ncbi:MAG: M23 family metallopeptidase [Firmicutes bacterium]|nr:M23 family metallopeptidase [Bacillota bacterium]